MLLGRVLSDLVSYHSHWVFFAKLLFILFKNLQKPYDPS